MSPSRCRTRSTTTGSTTPTCSPARAAAARPPAPASWLARSTATRARRRSRCGVCESCVELARGGPGSIDVIEIDAASHGGVDDARDLRERAFFAPMKARYKVYIIDEAHMVTPQGFNALLKLVEEPPSHLRFIFATTEPDKVIGTIRSRTHHYPFRLVPPKILGDYLVELCSREGVDDRADRRPADRAGRRRFGPRQPLRARPADGRLRARRRHLRPRDLPARLHPRQPARRDGRRLGRRRRRHAVRGRSKRSSTPARTRAGSPRTCCTGCATSSSSRAVPDAASRGLIELSDDQAERLSGQAHASAAPSSPGPPTSSARA